MKEKFTVPTLGDLFPFLDITILQDRLGWSIKLRWLAIVGYFAGTLIAKFLLFFTIPYHFIWTTLALLLLINILYYAIQKVLDPISFMAELILLTAHIVVDLFFLTLLIHFSGGIENPIYLFYLFHVVLSSIVFPRKYPYLISTVVVLLFGLLLFSEYNAWIPHYSIYDTNLYTNATAILITLTIFVVTVYVTTYICLTFMQIYRHSKQVIDRQNTQLMVANKQRMQFFRYASHELKSPLIAIKSTIDSVLATFSDKMDPTSVHLLQRASGRAQQMLEIIKDLLELSRPRAMMVEDSWEKVEVERVLDEVVVQEAVYAKEKNVNIVREVDLKQQTILMAKTDLEKIMRNLINNAVRYTPEGGEVKVFVASNDNELIIRVQDTGIGIAEKDLSRIFNEFYRSENAKKMVNFGTGLGLSLVKQIVESYGGTINVRSKIQQGSTFEVRLPLVPQKN